MNYNSRKDTSWNRVSGWYNKITRDKGHYFHQQVIIPKALKLLSLSASSNVLDLGCGNGVLAKSLPKSIKYTGVDLSENLIEKAKFDDKNSSHKYIIADITLPLNIPEEFSHAVIMLALQNVDNPYNVFKNTIKSLSPNGRFLIIINHPMFRIPRQTSWGFDEGRKIQYRRIDKYMSPMEIPINMNPSDRNSEITTSYHFSLNDYSKMLKDSGFVIELIEEWTSDKLSEGRFKKSEDRARNEIPLFMAILAKKI